MGESDRTSVFGFVIDDSNADDRSFRYSDEGWAALIESLPQAPQRERERRTRIEQKASWLIEGVFPPPPTNSEMVSRWQRVAKAAEDLEVALHDVFDEDEGYGYFRSCGALLLEAQANVRCYQRERTRRRKDNNYGLGSTVSSLLDLWTSTGGELRFSQGAREHPTGPLIEFLTMAFEPIAAAGLKPPSPFQLAHFIRKKRDKAYSDSSDTNDFE